MNSFQKCCSSLCLGVIILSSICGCEDEDGSLDGQWDVQVRDALGGWISVGSCTLHEDDDDLDGHFTLNGFDYDSLDGSVSDSTVTIRVYGNGIQSVQILTFTGFWDEDDMVLGTLRVDADATVYTARLWR